MAEMTMCESHELFNLLNQYRGMSRLAEINYLFLVDARETQDYYTSHIITAKNMKTDSDGAFLLPEAVEVDSMQHVVVYDSSTSRIEEQGRAVDCAQVLAKELENLKIYPVEIIAGLLYMGDQKQSMDASILRDLKISAVVCISNLAQTEPLEDIKGSQAILNIPVADSVESDLYSRFQKICSFVGSYIDVGSRVLIASNRGRSRCSAVTIAFLMQHFRFTLQEAWRNMLRCKPTMGPNTGFLQQLSDWELHVLGKKCTDVSQCHI